jgi:hypothetical protein
VPEPQMPARVYRDDNPTYVFDENINLLQVSETARAGKGIAHIRCHALTCCPSRQKPARAYKD